MASPSKIFLGSTKSPARSSFMFLKALQADKHGNMKCKTAILLPKSDKKSYKAMIAAVDAAGKKKFGDTFNCLKTKKYTIPFRDGDELADDPDHSMGEEARGHWVINATAYKIPHMVDRQAQLVIDRDELDEKLRSGNYFMFSVTFKPFDNESSGVRTELNNLMYVKEGETLDGSESGESEFEQYAMDSDSDDDDDDDDDDEVMSLKDLKKLFKAAKGADLKATKKALRETGESDISNVDEDDYTDLAEALQEIVDEADDDDDDDDDDEPVKKPSKKPSRRPRRK